MAQVQNVEDETSTTGPGGTVTPGRIFLHYTYDALGRLIARQTAWDSSQDSWKIEKFYHDGARRVQEVVSDELTGVNSPLDARDWPEGPSTSAVTSNAKWRVEREYIHVPAGAGGYIDEYLAQYDYDSDPDDGVLGYILQDVNFNVVALADSAGRPVAQYSYYPYGAIKALDIIDNSIGAPGPVRMGHQGLFYDRFDQPWSSQRLVAAGVHGNSGWLDQTTGVAAMLGRGVYQNRNRSYDPGLGRFIQRDVNASGQTKADWFFDNSPSAALADSFEVKFLHGDGMNLHAARRSDPIELADPLGLELGLGGLMAAMSVGQSVESTYQDQVQDTALSMMGWLEGTLAARALDDWADIYWATDWSQPDDFYSRSASYADVTGSWADFWGVEDGAERPAGPAMALDFTGIIGDSGATGGVYVMRDASNNVTYVGRTNDLARRSAEWKRAGKAIEVVFRTGSPETRRGLEQIMIDFNKSAGKGNKVAGVAAKNKNSTKYMTAAVSFLNKFAK